MSDPTNQAPPPASTQPGSTSPATSAPSEPAPQAQVMNVDAFAKAVNDKIFADLRRAGVLGKPKESTPESTQITVPTPGADQLMRLRALDRVVNSTGVPVPEAHQARMERAFLEENPPDPGAWVKDYLSPFGRAAQSPQVNTAPLAPTRSDSGSVSGVPAHSVVGNPLAMTREQVQADIRRDGGTTTGKKYLEQLRQAMQGTRLSTLSKG